jgi:hypothetical protein
VIDAILHFYGDFGCGINWKNFIPSLASLFFVVHKNGNRHGGWKNFTLGIMWNFITKHFTVLKCCAPSVTAELFNERNSIKLKAKRNLRIV